ncbi:MULTISPECIES: MarR family winged helix-turn-helix transcriptional regulator [unclassified Marinomonas]|uniref:MarR family winged helix-turn-helix transcriptional regulator n=1 Tax=unclassified Marinomonas TaxID=196814 RepID=UPI0007AEEE3E|nr:MULTISPECIES: MarR family transcriptional regulator [unclassified Marinomonas]
MSDKTSIKTSAPELDDLLCFSLYSTSLAMNKLYRKLLKPLDITYSQYLVLVTLWEQDEQAVNAIGERLYLDSATLTPLLKRMEASDLVTRKRALQDERSVIVSLTQNAKEMEAKVASIMEKAKCAANMDMTEFKEIKDKLEKLRDNLLKNM